LRTLISITVPAATFILFVAVGLDLTPADFARVRHQVAVVLTGLLAPIVLLPLVAVGLIAVFPLVPEVAAGLLLVAACPIGGMSNVFSYLARASPALSVTLTSLSCVMASVTIPLIGAGLTLALSEPVAIPAPIGVLAGQLVVVLGLPVVVGLVTRRLWPEHARRHRPALQRVSFIGAGIVIALVVAEAPGEFFRGWLITAPLAAVFVLCCFVVGWATAMLSTRDRRDRFTIATEFGTPNVGVATAIAVTLLGRVEFARFAATYFVTEVPLMLAAAWVFRRLTPDGPEPAEERGAFTR
jgi:BASS family bile acid:Na+ symporter